MGLMALAKRKVGLQGWRAGAFLGLSTLHLLVLAPEVGLRLAGFRYESGFWQGRSDGSSRFVRLVESESLFWTLPRDSPGVNPQGFRTLPLPRLEEAGLVRVVFLGDSLAYQGYPEIAATLLSNRGGEPRFEIINMSLAGYSSHQGRVVADTYGDALAADLVVIGYAWNDHWLDSGGPDEKRVVRPVPAVRLPGPAGRLTTAIFRRSRIAQAARYLFRTRSDEADPQLRVPPAGFRENLVYLGDYWRKRRVEVIFLTLPSAHDRLGVPDYLVDQGLATNKETVIALHRTYNQIVREVAVEGGWSLLDLDRQFAALPRQDLEQIFLADGIHLSINGLALVADRVAAIVADLAKSRITDAQPEEPLDDTPYD